MITNNNESYVIIKLDLRHYANYSNSVASDKTVGVCTTGVNINGKTHE